jgi:hypothetical protein
MDFNPEDSPKLTARQHPQLGRRRGKRSFETTHGTTFTGEPII